MKKKLSALLLCLCLTASLAACAQPVSQGTETLPPEGSPAASTPAVTNTPTPTPAPTPESTVPAASESTAPPVPDGAKTDAPSFSDTIIIRGRYAHVGAESGLGNYSGVVIPVSVKFLFLRYDYRWYAVFYEGTSEQFKKIDCNLGDFQAWADEAFMGDESGVFYFAPVYYYSETKPAEPGMYWHYDENDSPVVWE